MNDFIKWFESTYEGLDDIYEFCPSEIPSKSDFKFIFLSNYIFDVTTYDDELSYKFGKAIYEVMKAIQNRETFDYITNNYEKYILVCNLLIKFDLIEWGTSIRGAWFTDKIIKTEFGAWKLDGTPIYENPQISIKELIKWLEEENDQGSIT